MVKRSSLHVAGAVNVVVNAATLAVVTVEAALNSMAGAGVAKGPEKSMPAAGAIPCGDKAIMSFFFFFVLRAKRMWCLQIKKENKLSIRRSLNLKEWNTLLTQKSEGRNKV